MAGSATGTGNIYEFNNNYYEVVLLDSAEHDSAFLDAETRQYNGIQGHLVTITSAGENQFVTDYLNNVSAPIGEYYTAGSDAATEGTFIWVQGPEAGTNVEDDYTNWWSEGYGSGNEPNSYVPNYDYDVADSITISTYWDSSNTSSTDGGTWFDWASGNSVIKGYIVEYSAPLPPESSAPELNLGNFNGVSLNLINPYTTSTGKTYYYVDAGGDGHPDTRDSILQNGVGNEIYNDPVTHQQIDAIFNNGIDTTDYITSRSVSIDGYTITLPTLSEFQALREEVMANGNGQVITEGQFPGSNFIPEGWGGIDAFTYWTASNVGPETHELYGMGSNMVYSRSDSELQFFAVEVEHNDALGNEGGEDNTGEFVMPTTSDLTLRVDGVQVDNLEISRGESIDFSLGIDGGQGFPSNVAGGFGIPGESSGTSFLVSTNTGEELGILGGDDDQGMWHFGVAFSAQTTLSSGEEVFIDRGGDTGWETNAADRFLNLNIFTKNGTEIEYDSLRVDSSSFAGAFGQSADATYGLSNNSMEDLVGASETGDLYITVKTENLNTNVQTSHLLQIQQDQDGTYTVVDAVNIGFRLPWNPAVGADGTGFFIEGESSTIIDGDSTNHQGDLVHIAFDDGQATKVFDATGSNVAYEIQSIDRYGYGESDHLIFYDGDTGSIHLFSGDVTSTVNSSNEEILDTVTQSWGGLFSSTETGTVIDPLETITETDLNQIVSDNFSTQANGGTISHGWAWGEKLGGDAIFARINSQDVVVFQNLFGVGPEQYIYVDHDQIANNSGVNVATYSFSQIEDGGYFMVQDHQSQQIDYYVIDYTALVAQATVIDSIEDFASIHHVDYSDDRSNYNYDRNGIQFLSPNENLNFQAFEDPGLVLSIESMTAGEVSYKEIVHEENYFYDEDGFSINLSNHDYDGDGFVNFRVEAPAFAGSSLLGDQTYYAMDGYFTSWNGYHHGGNKIYIGEDTLPLSINVVAPVAAPPSAPVQQSESLVVTVVVDDGGGGNKYAIDGVQQDSLNLVEGETYVFDWSGASGHPLRFSTSVDGTHAGGAEYTDGVVVDHAAFTTTITVAQGAPDLHYYCEFHPGMGGSTAAEVSANELIREQLVAEALTDAGTDHLEPVGQDIFLGGASGDYAYVDRSFGGAVIYDADGTTSNIDFVGNENTFVLDASSEFDFFGYSYDPLYTDDSEVVVLQGSVGSGTRSIEFGESTDVTEDWDVVSFDGLNSGITFDLSQVDSNYDATATSNGQTVAYVDGAEGVFGSSFEDVIAGDGARNILHGGDGTDDIAGGAGQDLISGGLGVGDIVRGNAGEDILVDLDGGHLYGDDSGGLRENDSFVVGQNTTIQDFDLSPDGAGLSGRNNQINDVVFVQVTAASLAAAGFTLSEIYELVSGEQQYSNQWHNFVKDLEVEVVASDTVNNQPYNEIRLSIDGDNDGQATDIGVVSFLEASTGSGNYNAVKMKTQIEEILAQFESTTSDNAHVLEQFFGLDTLTAAQLTALDRAVDAGEDVEAAGGDVAAVIAAVEAELVGETFDAAQAVRDALTSQVGASTTSEVIAAVEDLIDDVVDVALVATDMDTSLFVPIAVEEVREGTVRTEVIEDRDNALGLIAAEAAANGDAAAAALRDSLLGKTTVVERVPEVADEPAPEAIVVLSNADDKVISTSGADDRFEVIPQVFVDSTGEAYDDDTKTDQQVAEEEQSFGQNVIVDLGARDAGTSDGGGSTTGGVIDPNALGDVVYLEGVSGIDGVNFERFQVGREGENSLKISATVVAEDVDENGNTIEVARNAGEVTVFKQFDALTDRFAVETLEISTTDGVSEYWSLSTAEADRSGGRITETYITTDVSNTGKGILIGSDAEADTYVVTGDGDAAQIKVVGFDSNDTIDLTSFGDDLTTSVNGSDVEVSNADGVVVTLIGLGDPDISIDEQLIGVQQI